MKPVTSWSFRPYAELYKYSRALSPYICRLEPGRGGFTVDFIDNGLNDNLSVASSGLYDKIADADHLVYYRPREEGGFIPVRPERLKNFFTADIACEDERDFEVYVERADGTRSSVRLVRTGYVPGTVINYLHPEDDEYLFSGRYLASPSLLTLPDGTILASMDVFHGEKGQNLTLIFRSTDGGKRFEYLTEVFPCFWGGLFIAGGKLYLIGCSREYGDLLIGRSDDGGATWTTPTVLFRGSSLSAECGCHRAPMKVEVSHGLVMTDVQYGAWAKGIFCDFVISAPEDSDLLDPANWLSSGIWNPDEHPEAKLNGVAGGIEGCVVTAPDGKVYDILRYAPGKLLKLRFDPSDREGELVFDGFIDCPINQSKVDIVFDEKTRLYFMIGSYRLESPATNRNLLSLLCSENLDDWSLVSHLIDYRDADPGKIGFQYVSFGIAGDDIIYQSRTAFNGAHNFHDSNYATFHRIENFRELLGKERG